MYAIGPTKLDSGTGFGGYKSYNGIKWIKLNTPWNLETGFIFNDSI